MLSNVTEKQPKPSRKKNSINAVPVELEKVEEQQMPPATPDVDANLLAGIKSRGQLEEEAAFLLRQQRLREEYNLKKQSGEKFTRSLQIAAVGTLGIALVYGAFRYFYSNDPSKLLNAAAQ